MTRPPKLTAQEIATALEDKDLAGWTYADEALCRTFKFSDFNAAWGFLSRVALVAESGQHHPRWTNVFNIVEIALSTHDQGGVTRLDVNLARRISQLREYGSRE